MYNSASSAGLNSALFLIVALGLLAFIVAVIASAWRVFTKAGRPGWAALIPFYNTYLILKIIDRPGWWLVLFFIPIVNFFLGIVVALDMAKAFGKSPLFGVLGLWIFSVIGYLIIGFGDARYIGRTPASGGAETQPLQ